MKRSFAASTGWLYNDQDHGPRTLVIVDPAWQPPTIQIPDPDWRADEHPEGTPHPLVGVPDPEAIPATIQVDNPDCKIPADAVEISEELYQELIAAASMGKRIQARPDGYPEVVDQPAPRPDEIWENIKAERDRRKTGGFQHAGRWYHSDIESKAQHLGNKDTARDQLAAGGEMADHLLDPLTGHQIVWKTMSGEFVPLTCQLAFDIVAAGKSAEFANYAAALAHKAAMERSANPPAYDYSGGWPQTYAEFVAAQQAQQG